MKIENGKLILEEGEKKYDAVLLEVKEMEGVSKEKQKAYHFFSCRLDLNLVNNDGEVRVKPTDATADLEIGPVLSTLEPYTRGVAVYVLGYDPTSTKAGKFVGFVPYSQLKHQIAQPVQQTTQK